MSQKLPAPPARHRWKIAPSFGKAPQYFYLRLKRGRRTVHEEMFSSENSRHSGPSEEYFRTDAVRAADAILNRFNSADPKVWARRLEREANGA